MKIKSITIFTTDLKSTEFFYSNILELPVVFQSDNELHYQIGRSTLKFQFTETTPSPYHYAFNINACQLDAAVEWASQRFELLTNPSKEIVTTFENWNAKSIYFYDNQKNLVEFIARHDLKDTVTSSGFDPSQITCISEIGIVTDHPIALATSWIEQYGLIYFKKSPVTDDFLALGDDEGLLVLVNPFRNWYPTLQKAKKTKVFIELENAGKKIYLHSDNILI